MTPHYRYAMVQPANTTTTTHMTPGESLKTCFSKYADFKGRASRPEFWWWALINLVASISLSIISDSLSLAFAVATLLPYLAVTTRRLHDVGRSGWWQLIGLIPILGWIVLIYWLAQQGTSGFADTRVEPV